MIYDMLPIEQDAKIDFIGFNIESGKIISEKIYYKKEKTEIDIIHNSFVKELLSYAKKLRFFSAENASINKGIIKYDFQIEDIFTWIKTMKFLEKKVPYYNKKTVHSISQITWLKTTFTTIGVRLKYDKIQDIELYYRRQPKKRTLFCRRLKKLVNADASIQCQKLMHLFFSNKGWIRLVAIDFQPNHQYIKIYLETENADLIYRIADNFKDTINQNSIYKMIEYAKYSNLLFAGMAIVMDKNSENVRYNFYFKQK